MGEGFREIAFGARRDGVLRFGNGKHLVGQFCHDLVEQFRAENPGAVLEVEKSPKSSSRYVYLRTSPGWRWKLRVSDHEFPGPSGSHAEIRLPRKKGAMGMFIEAEEYRKRAMAARGILRGWMGRRGV